jgi:hypothetical protein
MVKKRKKKLKLLLNKPFDFMVKTPALGVLPFLGESVDKLGVSLYTLKTLFNYL